MLDQKHEGTPMTAPRLVKSEGDTPVEIPKNRAELVRLFGKRRVQGLALAVVMSAGLGVAATSGAFASPASQTFAAASTPVATAAASPGSGWRGPGGGFGPGSHGGPGRFGGPQVDSVATFLGISTTDLHTALGNGQTLAQIAQAHGKSASDLKAYLLNQDSSRIDQLINTNFKQLQSQFPGGPGRGPGGPFGADVATFLGISQSDLSTALRSGQTLAQVAQAHGKSAADLTTFLTNQLKTRLDQAVSAGKMTSQQETTALSQASSRIGQMINSTGPKWGPPPAPPAATPTATPSA